MTATITQRRWASVGAFLTLMVFVATLFLLIQHAPEEIAERRYHKRHNEGEGFTVTAVSSTVTIIFLCVTLAMYLRLAQYCIKIVRGQSPFNPLNVDYTLDDEEENGFCNCPGCFTFFNWILLGLIFATLMAAFIVNLDTFGFESVSLLRGLVYTYGFLILGSLSLAITTGVLIILYQILIHLVPELYRLAKSCLRGLAACCKDCCLIWFAPTPKPEPVSLQMEQPRIYRPSLPAISEHHPVTFHAAPPPPAVQQEVSLPPPFASREPSSIAPPSGEYLTQNDGNLYSQNNCTLCHQKLEADLRKLDCGHLYHHACLTSRDLTLCPECIV